jgi:hypothetical protein
VFGDGGLEAEMMQQIFQDFFRINRHKKFKLYGAARAQQEQAWRGRPAYPSLASFE